ncbi:ferredoxin-type protein NapF [Rhodocyclaceae bacterium SMB388]
MSVSRRSFLRGRFRASEGALRPPWAKAAGEFEQCCTRCGDCTEACPTGIIKSGEGAYPIVDFGAGECTFCGDCVTVCEPGALRRVEGQGPWALKLSIAESCLARQGVECRVCGECCGASVIRFRPRLGGVSEPEPDVARCTGCGACVAPCPVGAIAMEMHQ